MEQERNLPPLRGLDEHAGDVENGVIRRPSSWHAGPEAFCAALLLSLGIAGAILWLAADYQVNQVQAAPTEQE